VTGQRDLSPPDRDQSLVYHGLPGLGIRQIPGVHGDGRLHLLRHTLIYRIQVLARIDPPPDGGDAIIVLSTVLADWPT
jgi:hypothetical protein